MKKCLYAFLLMGMMSVSTVCAQDKYVFNHLALGAEVGTTGIGLELAAPLTMVMSTR